MTKDNQQDEAHVLASRPYALFVFLDETTDGDTIYVATNPELPGCIAQGDSIVEAEDILTEVRQDYIAHRLAHNLPVPEPQSAWTVGQQSVEQSFAYRIIEPEPQQSADIPDFSMQVAISA